MMTAYWVVYVNGDIEKETKAYNLNIFKQGDLITDMTHYYSKLIPGDIRMQVDDDNRKMQEEIGEYKTA
jgi:hypothetical protein